MAVSYSQNSPYYTTSVYNNLFLDIMDNRDITPDPTDVYWQITQTYHMRPDMLAYDLYENSQLWWVFAQRNPNMIKDPLFDFVAGTYIFLPQLDNLKTQLSL